MRKKDFNQPLWSLDVIMDNTSGSFILLDRELKIVAFNKVAQKRAEDLGVYLVKGKSILDQAIADRRAELLAMYNNVLSGTPEQYYLETSTRDGQPIIYHLEYLPLRNNGEISGIMVNARDVTIEQQALKKVSLAEKKFRSLIDEGDDLILIIDREKKFAFISPNVPRILGYEVSEFLDMHLDKFISEYIHTDDQALLHSEYLRIQNLRKLHIVPFRFRNGKGNWEWLESTLTNLSNEEQIQGIIANSHVITERLEFENTLQQTYQQINKIFQSSLDIICTIDSEGRFVQLSNATESILGYYPEDLKGKYLIDFIHPEDRKETLDIFTSISQGKVIRSMENRIIHSNGSFVPMMWSASINEADRLAYCVGRDITEKKVREKQNKENSELIKAIVQSMNESILVINPQAELIYANDSFLKVTGNLSAYDYESWSRMFPLFDKDTRKRITKEERPVILALHGQTIVNKEYLILDPLRGELTVLVNASPIKDSNGNLIAAMSVKRDVTEQKIAEEKIRKKEEQVSKIFNTVSEVLFMIKVEGVGKYRFAAVNKPFLEATGLPIEKVINHLIEEVIPQPSLSLVLEKYAQAIKMQKQLTWEEETNYPAGTKTGIVTVTPTFDEQGECIELIGSVNDITSTKEAAVTIYKSNERFEYVTKATSEAIWDWDLITNEFYRGNGFKTLFGLNIENTTGDVSFWQAYIHPEDKPRIQHSIEEVLKSNDLNWTGQYRYLKANGEFAYVSDRSVIIRSEDGKPIRMIGAMQDITKSKQAENLLMQQNEELLKINQELDSFVYSASHELRSPLTAIMGLIILSRSKRDNPEDLDNFLNLMEKSVQNLDQVIKDIINYSKNARLEVENQLIDFEAMIKESINLFNYLEGGDKVTFNIEMNEYHPFYSDKNRMATVLNNIISNSIKYRNPEAKKSMVDIKITQKAHSAELVISDNGLGIPQEKQAEVFKMFYRLSSKMPGSGLGLFIVKEILNKLGGTVEISSAEGQGTTFFITIPNGHVPNGRSNGEHK
jgi:PAS domain S-box-containing protein